MDERQRRVGVVGAGNIGRPMAERLLTCGFDVLVCDLSADVRSHFVAARTARYAREAAGEDAVLLLVANDEQLEAAIAGPGGLIEGLAPHGPRPVVAIMSTVAPDTVTRLAAEMARHDLRVIDAPVSGGAVRAADGRLTIMAGGDAGDIAAIRPVLDALAATIHHCGALGQGQTTKIINNMVGVTNLFLFSEAMDMAGRLGLDLGRLAVVMEQSSGRNAGTADWVGRLKLYAAGTTSPEATDALVKVTIKDLGHARELARKAGLATPILDAVAAAHSQTASTDIFERWRHLVEQDETA